VGLRTDGKEFIRKKKVDISKAQATLPLIEKILKEKNITLRDLNSIEVNTGPGSFTGIRVGISIANALAFILNIPVNGNKAPYFAEASYT
ncbi:MAG: tRNA (adenosine(37)-N6)-threonylcarbamoyltransferase complex dimerization subunit type 1 TsaB, partial [Candidatus Levyibacteriota bacterium]